MVPSAWQRVLSWRRRALSWKHRTLSDRCSALLDKRRDLLGRKGPCHPRTNTELVRPTEGLIRQSHGLFRSTRAFISQAILSKVCRWSSQNNIRPLRSPKRPPRTTLVSFRPIVSSRSVYRSIEGHCGPTECSLRTKEGTLITY